MLSTLAMPAITQAQTPAPASAVQQMTGPVSAVVGNLRVQVLSPTLIRLEVKGSAGFEDRSTFHVVNRTDWPGDAVEQSETDSQVVLTTSRYRILIPKDADTLKGVKVTTHDGKGIWKYTRLPGNSVKLPDLNEYVRTWEIADTPRMVPAEWGFSPMPEDQSAHAETNGWDTSNDAPDMYVFLPDGDNTLLRREFIELTGRTEMIPLSAFGVWDSRWYAYSEETALKQIDDYHSRNFPLDNLVVDTDWRAGGATAGAGYDINETLFPDMQRFLSRAHEKNVSVMFNDHPEPTKDEGGANNNVLAPQEVRYRFDNLTRLLNMGLDTWWYDRNWSVTVQAPQGYSNEVMGMAVYANAVRSVYPDRRLLMMSNVDDINDGIFQHDGNIAAHRYSIQWTGDTQPGMESMKREVGNAVHQGANYALPYVSTDLGAYYGVMDNQSKAEYIRWIQFGALSPIYRVHGKNDGHMPWLKDQETLDICRDYANLRYRLLPVFYSLSHENYQTGLPLVRRLDFNYPQYESAAREDQYTLGNDILVAPITEDTGEMGLPVSKEMFTTPDGEQGIRAEYYNNKELSGEPVLTRTEDNIHFAWQKGSPDPAVNADAFSAAFTGFLTVGDYDIKLQGFVDDGIRVYIDDEKIMDDWKPQSGHVVPSDKVLEAGKTYKIRVEYLEDKNTATCQLNYVPSVIRTVMTREVWIPEGEWINTFTGETVYGPQTIEVSCDTDELPVFVRKGAILPLADEMLTTKEKDWSHLTLDVYPSTRQQGTSTLYEDDTESTAYENGAYRTTTLSTSFDAENRQSVVSIGAADGSFSGERAFSRRDWTIRVHQPENWGELRAVTCGGEELAFQKIEADADAMPFENAGGARDAAVYMITFSGDVSEAKELRLTFDNPADAQIPDGDYDQKVPLKDKGYIDDGEFYESPVSRTVTVSEVPAALNLTDEGRLDWLHAGYGGVGGFVQKAGVEEHLLTFYKNLTDIRPLKDYRTKFSWRDGDAVETARDTQTGLYTRNQGDSFELEIRSDARSRDAVLYVGGWRSAGTLEIYDETEKEPVDVYRFEDMGGSYYKKVTIRLDSEKKSRLTVKYTLTEKERSSSNITFTAATIQNTPVVGDADGDGKLGVTDLILLKQHILGRIQLDGKTCTSCDANGDGRINIFDLVLWKLAILKD